MNTTTFLNVIQIGALVSVAGLTVYCIFLLIHNKKDMHKMSNYLMVVEERAQKDTSALACVKCEHPVQLVDNFCYWCSEPNPRRKTCIKCNTMTFEDARYCPSCRNRLWLEGSTVEGKPLFISGKLSRLTDVSITFPNVSTETSIRARMKRTRIIEVPTEKLQSVNNFHGESA